MGGGFAGGLGGAGGTPGGVGERNLPLQGLALFSAQSAVLEKYPARISYEFVAQLLDAQITGKTVDDVFTQRGLGSVFQLDADWRNWLAQRADLLNRR